MINTVAFGYNFDPEPSTFELLEVLSKRSLIFCFASMDAVMRLAYNLPPAPLTLLLAMCSVLPGVKNFFMHTHCGRMNIILLCAMNEHFGLVVVIGNDYQNSKVIWFISGNFEHKIIGKNNLMMMIEWGFEPTRVAKHYYRLAITNRSTWHGEDGRILTPMTMDQTVHELVRLRFLPPVIGSFVNWLHPPNHHWIICLPSNQSNYIAAFYFNPFVLGRYPVVVWQGQMRAGWELHEDDTLSWFWTHFRARRSPVDPRRVLEIPERDIAIQWIHPKLSRAVVRYQRIGPNPRDLPDEERRKSRL